MSSAVMPRAKERPRRTRTKRISHLPAIVVSALPLNNIDLFPGTESLVCPDCQTWCPVTGQRGPTPKLVPHHTGQSEVGAAIRCRSSNRRVTFDLTVAEWNKALAEAHKETLSRRPSTVLRKPKTAPAPAVTQMPTPPVDEAAERKARRRFPARRASQWASVLPAVRDADGRRHQVVVEVPAGTGDRDFVNPQERIRRKAAWPTPMHGGPALPLELRRSA
ncbi:hypothetical protein ACFV0R_22130 [Streptomyces sp. NPDC059578]|uniref:hypothetical protein n=1 Tax=Streptomyces sp. NPDC059578 TaxID=3346874 RepID=UPI00368A49C4